MLQPEADRLGKGVLDQAAERRPLLVQRDADLAEATIRILGRREAKPVTANRSPSCSVPLRRAGSSTGTAEGGEAWRPTAAAGARSLSRRGAAIGRIDCRAAAMAVADCTELSGKESAPVSWAAKAASTVRPRATRKDAVARVSRPVASTGEKAGAKPKVSAPSKAATTASSPPSSASCATRFQRRGMGMGARGGSRECRKGGHTPRRGPRLRGNLALGDIN